jgi:hypothetical protein
MAYEVGVQRILWTFYMNSKHPFIYCYKTTWDIIKELLSIVIVHSAACRKIQGLFVAGLSIAH